ncbi:histone family protein [Methanosphaera sp.]|uniref:histone family protein n=1 Tax=Methanosphaera sp. TaxID=2666342 RepID=UPI0025E4D095|nr:histone family protein [Methanosphaera sp.]MEE1116823.1 histone family protein [Methanosphaera sp.]MEE3324336.1 histone family protein [Methanosphaera sp.]MEE3418202.1 histone family protein [Methanosphaera sp.]
MTEIPKAPVTRIVKSAGAERISKDAEEKIVEAVEAYTASLATAVIDVAKHAGRKTIQPDDVEVVLKHFKF